MARWQPVVVDGEPFDSGVFLLDKPEGMSSFAVVKLVRRLLGVKKVGHAGTLDPFASGLLVVCAGRPATRQVGQFMAGRKVYAARIQLGLATDTMDPEGVVVAKAMVPELAGEEVDARLAGLIGPGMQVPPPYSAVKYRGKPLYEYARRGEHIVKEARPVSIDALEVRQWRPAEGILDVVAVCSPGTYIRVLAEDIGRALGSCAHVSRLRRIASGGLSVEAALEAVQLQGEHGLERLLAQRLEVEEALHRAGAPGFCLASEQMPE